MLTVTTNDNKPDQISTLTPNDNKPDQTYVELTSNTFKIRLSNHKNSFKYRRKKYSTKQIHLGA